MHLSGGQSAIISGFASFRNKIAYIELWDQYLCQYLFHWLCNACNDTEEFGHKSRAITTLLLTAII